MRFAFGIAVLLTAAAASPQPVARQWLRTQPTAHYPVRSVGTDQAGNVYAAGEIIANGSGDCRIVKYSPAGVVLWTRVVTTPNTFADPVFDGEGNTFVAGTSWDATDVFATITKVGPDGNLVWEKKIDDVDQWRDATFDAFGELVLTGSVTDTETHVVTASYFATSGVRRWLKKFRHAFATTGGMHSGGQITTNYLRDVHVLATTQRATIGLTLIAYASNGGFRWSRDIPFSNVDHQAIIGETRTGEIILASAENGVLTVRAFNDFGIDHLVAQVALNVDRPIFEGFVSLPDGSFFLNGYGFFARYYDGQIHVTYLPSSDASIGGRGGELYFSERLEANVYQDFATLRAEVGQQQWIDRIFGSVSASSPFRTASINAMAIDRSGDLVLGGMVTTAPGNTPFVAKYRCEPQANPDGYRLQAGETLTVEARGLLQNDFQFTSATLSLVNPPQHGELTLGNEGAFSYRPDPGFAGVDVAYYRLQRDGYSSTAAITFDVFPALIDAKFTPVTIGGGNTATLRVRAATPFNVATRLPISGMRFPILAAEGTVYFQPGAEWGSRSMPTAPVQASTSITLTVTSGTSTRSATLNLVP